MKKNELIDQLKRIKKNLYTDEDRRIITFAIDAIRWQDNRAFKNNGKNKNESNTD